MNLPRETPNRNVKLSYLLFKFLDFLKSLKITYLISFVHFFSKQHPGELPAVEGQGGGVEEEQPPSEEHKHVRCHLRLMF